VRELRRSLASNVLATAGDDLDDELRKRLEVHATGRTPG
jgi:hypothetical protein